MGLTICKILAWYVDFGSQSNARLAPSNLRITASVSPRTLYTSDEEGGFVSGADLSKIPGRINEVICIYLHYFNKHRNLW